MYIYKCINKLLAPSYYHGYKLSHTARNPRNLQALYVVPTKLVKLPYYLVATACGTISLII